ncbi:AAA domain-containing protein [Halorubrum saccharovorum]|uniref:AAA domain-containing protein n=1 Tax=Halorubrum saccharovorum TaxID=2248 RepID=UPI00191070DF|nr:AAA domain-containing protein [Halorubrum saccharovorum]
MSESFDDDLNQEQQLAVEYALLADELFCIHGPPGTGKTRTLVEIIRRAVDAGEDVLVCTDSNQALDNLVAGNSTQDDPDAGSLHAYGQCGTGEFTLDRVNAERSTHDVLRENYRDVAERAQVVAATNSSAATLAREFDLLVLDEATQSTCTASCIPLARVDRAVLAGDHQQLPPFTATEDPPIRGMGSHCLNTSTLTAASTKGLASN